MNDRYGHHAGGDVLKALGLLLLQRLRTIDLAGRYGGGEIVLILPGTQSTQAQHLIIELLLAFSALRFTGKESQYSVTFSAGIAEFPTFNTLDALTEAADQALYRAKAEGRNRSTIAAVAGS